MRNVNNTDATLNPQFENSNRDRRINRPLVVCCHDREPDEEHFAHGLPYLEILKGWSKDSIFPADTENGAWTAIVFSSSIENVHFKEFWILILQYNNSLRAPWKGMQKSNQNQNVEAKNSESNQTVITTINREFDWSLHP